MHRRFSNRRRDVHDALRMRLCKSFNNKLEVIFPPPCHHALSEDVRPFAAQDGQRVRCSAWRRATSQARVVEGWMRWRAFVGGVVFAAATGLAVYAATAADLPVAPAPVPVAPVASAPGAIFSWTGFYIGGHVGGGFERSSWSDPFTGANNAFTSGAGFLGGAQAGANVQFNRLVLGVEGDFSYAGLKGGEAGIRLVTTRCWCHASPSTSARSCCPPDASPSTISSSSCRGCRPR